MNWCISLLGFLIEELFPSCWLIRCWTSKCNIRKRSKDEALFLFTVVYVWRTNVIMNQTSFMHGGHCIHQIIHQHIEFSKSPWIFNGASMFDDEREISRYRLKEYDLRVVSNKLILILGLNGVISYHFVEIWRVQFPNNFISVYLVKGI